MAEISKQEMLTEAYNRGLLPPDKRALYEEAQRRGIIGSSQSQPKPDTISGGKAAAYGVTQGATFGFADELLAGIIAPFSDLTYPQLRDAARERQKEAIEQKPAQYIGGSIAGGVATLPVMPNVFAPAKTAGQAIKQAVGIGAAQGALQGFGEGEGSLSDRLGSAATGTAVGGVLGGGFSGAGQLAKSTVQRAARGSGLLNVGDEQAARVARDAILKEAAAQGVSPDQPFQR